MLKKPAAIFFDWDGTLIDGFTTIVGGYNAALSYFNLPLMTPDMARKKIRRSAREVFPLVFGEENAPQAMRLYFDYVRTNHLQTLQPIAGVESMLDKIRARDIVMGVVSNKTDPILRQEVEHLGWMPLFKAVLGAGITPRDKPAPDPLLKIAGECGLTPQSQELWYIGDTETDMLAANAAGYRPIFIGHGLAEFESLDFSFDVTHVKDAEALIGLMERFD